MASLAALKAAIRLKPGDLASEYLTGGTDNYLGPLYAKVARVLATNVDDLTADFGDEVYDDMMTDAVVNSSVETLRVFVASGKDRIASPVKDENEEGYELAAEIAGFVDREWRGMDLPAVQVKYSLMDYVIYGSCLAEIVLTDPKADFKTGRIVSGLKALKVKNRKKYAFVVDEFMNVLGVVNRSTGYHTTGSFVGPNSGIKPEDVIPREKFLLLTFNSRNGDPRGRSILRSIWNMYSLKVQTLPQWLKYLVQFASPSLFATTPEKANEPIQDTDADGEPITDPFTGLPKMTTPQAKLYSSLLDFMSGTVTVAPFGTTLVPLFSQGEGNAFIKALEHINREIVLAILKTARTTLEAKNGSKADSESAQDVTSVFIDFIRQTLSDAIRQQVFYRLVEANYGTEAAERYLPELYIGGEKKQDFASTAEAISKLWMAGVLHVSQIPGIWAMLELPKGDFKQFLAEHQQKADEEAALRTERAKLVDPRTGNEDADPQQRAA